MPKSLSDRDAVRLSSEEELNYDSRQEFDGSAGRRGHSRAGNRSELDPGVGASLSGLRTRLLLCGGLLLPLLPGVLPASYYNYGGTFFYPTIGFGFGRGFHRFDRDDFHGGLHRGGFHGGGFHGGGFHGGGHR